MTTTYAERRALASLASYRAIRLDEWAEANGVSYQYAADLFAALEEDDSQAVFLRYVNALAADRRGRRVLRAVALYGPGPLSLSPMRRCASPVRSSAMLPAAPQLSAADVSFLHRSTLEDATTLLRDYGSPWRTHASDMGTRIEAASPQNPRQLLLLSRDRRGQISVGTRDHDTGAERPLALFSDVAIRLWSFSDWPGWLRSLRDELASLGGSAGYSSAA